MTDQTQRETLSLECSCGWSVTPASLLAYSQHYTQQPRRNRARLHRWNITSRQHVSEPSDD